MTHPGYLIKEYKIPLMLTAKQKCLSDNGSLEEFPEELKTAVISLYYEHESFDEQKAKVLENDKSKDIKVRRKYLKELGHLCGKSSHISRYLKLIPQYIAIIRNSRLDKRNYRKFVKEAVYEITYGLSYQESSIITK